MNRTHLFLCLLAGTLLLSSCTREVTLTFVQTSDTHSCIDPDAKTDMGGYARRAVLIDSLRTHVDPYLLLFDCGDYSQGSLFYTLFKGETEVRLMNAMGYDAVTIGNHEFDFGEENMQRLFQMANFPVLTCNYDVTGTPLEGCIQPYTLFIRKGIRIGVFGVSPKMEGLVFKTNYAGINYLDPVVKANETAAWLRSQEHCDLVVCLSHLGWQMPLDSIDDERFIAQTHGIDLVMGGHSHSVFTEPALYNDADGHPVPLMHNGKSALYVGQWQVTVKQTGIDALRQSLRERIIRHRGRGYSK